MSKHQIYSKNWSRNYTKLRLANSKDCKQLLSSAFFHIPPLQSSTSGQAASALFHPAPGQISTFSLSPGTGHQTTPFLKKTLPFSTTWLSLRTSMLCQVMQGLLPAPQIGDRVIQITLTRALFIFSTENIKATPKDPRFQSEVIYYNPFCFCRYVFFIKPHQSGN